MTATENYGLTKPDPLKNVDEEFVQLQLTLDQLDAIIHAISMTASGKANAAHGHAMGDITDLINALAEKMPASTTFSLDSLTDVDGAAGAAVNYVLVKTATGWVPSSAIAALGLHQHASSDISGLDAELTNIQSTFNAMKWLSKGIGELVAVWNHMAGYDAPPTEDTRYRFIALQAGLSGAGQYNEGVLTSESVSGSSPYIVATAVISLVDSPLNGTTVHLINTERRFLRAGSSGGLQDDELKSHTHAIQGLAAGSSISGGTGYTGTSVSTGAAGGEETRPRNIGVTYYMRIK